MKIVKKGFRTYNLVDTTFDNHIINEEKIDKSILKNVKLTKNGAIVKKDGIRHIFKNMNVYDNNQVELYNEENNSDIRVRISRTGNVSPFYVYNYGVYIAEDENGKLISFDDDGNATYSNYNKDDIVFGKIQTTSINNHFAQIEWLSIKKDGKIGLYDPHLNNIFPHVLDKMPEEFLYQPPMTILFTDDALYTSVNGKVVFTMPIREGEKYDILKNGFVSLFDPKLNKSTVLKFARQSGNLLSHNSFETKNAVNKIIEEGNNLFCLTPYEIYKNGKEILQDFYFGTDELQGESIITLRNKKENKVGIYSPKKADFVLEPKYNEISLNNSGKYNDEYRFMVKNDAYGKWGVVNDKGETLLNFKFENNGKINIEGKTYSILRDKLNKVAFVNLSNPEIVLDEEKSEKLLKEIYKQREKAVQNSYNNSGMEGMEDSDKENEIIGNAALISMLYESPIAGLFYYGMKSDEKDEGLDK